MYVWRQVFASGADCCFDRDQAFSQDHLGPVQSHEHLLTSVWCFWFTRKAAAKTPPPTGSKSDHSWYEKIVKPIATVRSVEEFWACYSHLVRPNELVSPSDYHLFRQGISPLWEDEANQKGGKWMVRLRKGLASEKWESLILSLVGDSTGIGEEICGCVASIRYQEDIIAVWNRDASDEAKKQKICDAMRTALDLPKGTVLEYKEHNASLRDNSSFRNTNVYRPPNMRGGAAVAGGAAAGPASSGGGGGGGGGGLPLAGSAGVGPIGSGVLLQGGFQMVNNNKTRNRNTNERTVGTTKSIAKGASGFGKSNNLTPTTPQALAVAAAAAKKNNRMTVWRPADQPQQSQKEVEVGQIDEEAFGAESDGPPLDLWSLAASKRSDAMDNTCVQCNGRYEEADTCAFHLSSQRERSGWSCCGTNTAGCVTGKKHSTTHHCEFPYGSFFAYAWGILNYTDTTESFGSIELQDLDTHTTEIASVGHLLRYVSRGDYIGPKNLLLLRVGSVSKSSPYFFKVFSEADLDAAAAALKPGSALIFRNTPKTDQYAQASWIVTNQLITGVRLEVKVACFSVPTVQEIIFSQFPLKFVEKRVISTGGIVEKRPSEAVVLPEKSSNVAVLPDLSRVVPRAARNDFITIDGVTNKQEVDVTVDSIKPNQDRVFDGNDNFSVALSIASSSEQATHMFKQLRVEYKLLNAEGWKVLPADNVIFQYKCFPLPLGPFQSGSLEFSIHVSFEPKRRPNFYRSFVARHTPLRFRFSFVDAKDRTVSRVAEYVQAMPRLENKDSGLFLFLDDIQEVDRESIHIEAKDSGNDLMGGAQSLDIKKARSIVHSANKTGVTEVEFATNDKDAVLVKYYALVDLSCQSVYAVKAQLISKKTGIAVQGFLPIRFYGEADAPQSLPAAAHLTAALPATVRDAPTVESAFVYDDKGLDDVKPPAVVAEEPAAGGAAGGGGGSVNLANVEKQLAALNDNLARTAAALEALVQLKLNKHKK